MATFNDYVRALRLGTIYPVTKLEFLDVNGLPSFIIREDFISGGQLTVQKQDGVRRTASITLSNLDHAHDFNPNKIWIGQQVRMWAGIRLPSGEDYFLPQGVFYITNPEESYMPNARTMQLSLIDKWAGLDGTVGGTLDGIYQINPKDNLFTAIEQLLLIDRGNGQHLDDYPPVLDSSYLSKTCKVSDAYGNISNVSVLDAPYTLRTEAENTYADVLLGINTMLVSSCGYDNMGHLVFRSANTDDDDSVKPVAWQFSVNEREFYGYTTSFNINEMCNDVRIIGAVVNGAQVSGRATNTNPASDYNVFRVGYNTYTETRSKYYTYEQCNELARYYLKRKTIEQRQVSFSTTPIYHLNEDMTITLLRPEVSHMPEQYIVTGYTLPLGGTGAMTINAVSVNDLSLYDKWDAHHSLSVLCSQIGELTCEYGTNSVTTLTNPYNIVEIPEGTTVTFTVSKPTGGTAYRISSAVLNGVALDHNGTTCSFAMPNYDSKLVFILTATSGNDVTYTYTGQSSVETVTSGSRSWKQIMFTTSGTLSLDATQVENGITADIWVRGGGGGGSAEAAGKNGYDVSEAGVRLDSATIAITIGTGGQAGTTRGRAGGGSSWGTLLQAPGGSAGGSAVTNNGGTLEKVFGLTEDTTHGKGGEKNAAGANGCAWLRIAI